MLSLDTGCSLGITLWPARVLVQDPCPTRRIKFLLTIVFHTNTTKEEQETSPELPKVLD